MTDRDPQGNRPTTFNLLFVCTGNTCRSALAEVIARARLEERGWTQVRVSSAGTAGFGAARASEGARTAVREIGLDLDDHRARPLTEEVVREADIVLAMTPAHVDVVEALGGEDKVSLLSEFLEGSAPNEPIEDPFGGTDEEFARARDRIREAVDGLLERLEAILAP